MYTHFKIYLVLYLTLTQFNDCPKEESSLFLLIGLTLQKQICVHLVN